VTAILQHAPSVYETDLFLPIIQGIERITGARYGESERLDYSLRVLADHGRAMTFLVGDGVKPSNEGRGYVLRRIIRRAARYGQRLGLQRPFLADVVELVINRMAARYPALASPSQRVQIAEIVRTEERRFLTTLQSGLGLLDRWIEEAKAAGQTELAGERIFQLYDTYGFPKELSEEIASEAGLSIGGDAYDRAMAEQRARSRGAIDQRTRLQRRVGEASELLSQPPTVFLGYDRLDTGSEILAIQADGADAARLHEGDRGSVVLAETPFYAEGGGQVGDTGHIVTPSGIFRVEDTQKDGAGHYLHVGQVEHGEVLVGEAADAAVDPDRRYDIMRHHSATHLLHKSLQTILGPKAVQAGSLVSPQLARFDFPNEGPVSAEQLAQIEDLVNREILEDLPVHIEELPFQEAVGQGASAFFGEKYGERVRVVTMGDFSKELCGGTHVRRTGELGAAYVLAESGIGSGMRRIEVVAGRAAHELARARSRQVESVAARLGTSPQRLEERVESLLAELREVRREAARMEAQLADVQAASLGQGVETVGSATVMAARVDAQSMDALLQMMDAARRAHESGVIVLAAVIGGKPQFVIGVSKDLIRPGFDAVALLRHVAAPTGGSGGGRPELARGGGQDASKLDEALGLVAPFVREHLGQ
jgi:alanyl-tRNA synthetase